MMRVALAGALALSFVTLAVAETVPPGMAARTELHAIDTLTLSDAQFLRRSRRQGNDADRTTPNPERFWPAAARHVAAWFGRHGREC